MKTRLFLASLATLAAVAMSIATLAGNTLPAKAIKT
jgi:hypothetical protein